MWLKSANGKNNGKVRDNSSLATKSMAGSEETTSAQLSFGAFL